MKCKIIVAGLMLLILLFPNLPVIANLHAEEELEKTARELYEVIMCPICSGQTIAQSNSGTSIQMRNLILKKLHRGETKEEILQYFVSKYGERIIAKPSKKVVFAVRIRRLHGNRNIFSASPLVRRGSDRNGVPHSRCPPG